MNRLHAHSSDRHPRADGKNFNLRVILPLRARPSSSLLELRLKFHRGGRRCALVSRFHSLAIFTAALLLPASFSRAATLDIAVQDGGWGAASPREVRTIVVSAAEE